MMSSTPLRALGAGATVLLAALVVGACGGSAGTHAAAPVPPKTATGQAATVGVESDGALGKVLVDTRGRTLYLFGKDSGGKSTCASACAAGWPPLRATGTPLAGPGLTASKLGTTPRSDGEPQVTYNGHPLYRYAGDAKPGDANGQRLTAFGAAWFAVSGLGIAVTRPGSASGGGIY
jgi:predicted lipoprotein with Yx(FWY)xxD motif